MNLFPLSSESARSWPPSSLAQSSTTATALHHPLPGQLHPNSGDFVESKVGQSPSEHDELLHSAAPVRPLSEDAELLYSVPPRLSKGGCFCCLQIDAELQSSAMKLPSLMETTPLPRSICVRVSLSKKAFVCSKGLPYHWCVGLP